MLICARTAKDSQVGGVIARTDCRAPGSSDRHDSGRLKGSGRQQTGRRDRKTWGRLDTWVCNAGVTGPKGAIDRVDWDAWQDAIAVNLNGTVLCCRAFLPLLRRSGQSKIILLSGGGATKPLPFLSAYAASKAAVARFGETLPRS